MPSQPSQAFSGQNWKGADFYPDNSSSRRLVDECVGATNWDALCSYASALKNGMKCKALPNITNGLFHLVRLLAFEDGTRWVARIQMCRSTERLAKKLKNEVDAIALVRERTKIPVPQVFGYEIDDRNLTGAAFILMGFLPGNVAMDASGGYETHHGEIPQQYKADFYDQVAQVQVQMASVRLPKIGTIIKNNNGSYDIGPLPDIGGPFETATAFFEAWAAHAKFPISKNTIQKSMKKGPVDRVLSSIMEFPSKLKAVASRVSNCDGGPFPLCHTDFLHSNIIINHSYNILGVIDWEGVCTVPWELLEFPLFLDTVPFPMDAPWNYDENGKPLDDETRQRWEERKEYAERVARFEVVEQMDDKLSTALKDHEMQNFAYAVRVFLDPGKLGFYDKVLVPFQEKIGRGC